MAKPLNQQQVDEIFFLDGKGLTPEQIAEVLRITKERVRMRLRGKAARIVRTTKKRIPPPDHDFRFKFETEGFFDVDKWGKHFSY
jgi:hypothetical protein